MSGFEDSCASHHHISSPDSSLGDGIANIKKEHVLQRQENICFSELFQAAGVVFMDVNSIYKSSFRNSTDTPGSVDHVENANHLCGTNNASAIRHL